MDSIQIKIIIENLTTWQSLNKTNVDQAPLNTGLYIFRKKDGERFGRLNGESDIIYIGSATGGSGIKARLNSHLKPGPSQQTNLRSKWLQERVDIEVAWAEDPGTSQLEDALLEKYVKVHWELPPLNRSIRGPWGKPEK